MTADITAALRRGDTVAALEAARAAVAAEPENPAAHHLLSLALMRQGDREAARVAIDQAILLAPDRAMFQLSRATLAMGEGDLARAEEGMKQALALDPNELPAYIALIHMALAQGRNQDAEEQLKLAQRVSPEHPHVLVAEGHVAQLKGQADAALKCFTAAVEADPGFALAQVSLGMAYLQRGHLAFAEQALRNAVALDAANPGVLRALAEAYRKQGKLADALDTLDQLLAQQPDARTRSLRGQLRVTAGQFDEALEDFLAVLDALPGHEAVLRIATDLLRRQGRADEALQRVEAALARESRDAYWAMRLQFAGSDLDAVRSVLDRWSAAMPQSPYCLDQRAHLHEQLGESDQALASAESALALAPRMLSSELLIVRQLLARDPKAALERLSKWQVAADDAAGQRTLLGLRGLALDRLGRRAEAAQCWQTLAQHPSAQFPLPAPAAAESLPEIGGAGHLLWAPPGVRVDRLLLALAPQLAGRLLTDRSSHPNGRPDGYGPMRARPGTPGAGNPQRWHDILQSAGLDPVQAVDWLPHYDAYTAASLAQAQHVACLIDPRDALLNWMVFGSSAGYAFHRDPEKSAEWLARCLEALADHRDAHPQSVTVVKLDDMAEAPQAVAESLQAAFGLAEPVASAPLTGLLIGIGGVPLQFTAGHWRQYREPLAAAFARLTAVAQRFGYPAE